MWRWTPGHWTILCSIVLRHAGGMGVAVDLDPGVLDACLSGYSTRRLPLTSNSDGALRLRMPGPAANRRKVDAYAKRVGPIVMEMQAKGMTARAIARALTAQGIVTPRGGTSWTGTTVRRVLARHMPESR